MRLVDRPLVEITLDEIKEAVTGYWIEMFKNESFSRDIILESGVDPISQWSTDALLAFYSDVELARLVRKQLDLPGAVIAYRKDKYDLVDLSSHIDEWEEKKRLKQLGCKCGSNDVCGKCDQFNTDQVSFDDDEIPF